MNNEIQRLLSIAESIGLQITRDAKNRTISIASSRVDKKGMSITCDDDDPVALGIVIQTLMNFRKIKEGR